MKLKCEFCNAVMDEEVAMEFVGTLCPVGVKNQHSLMIDPSSASEVPRVPAAEFILDTSTCDFPVSTESQRTAPEDDVGGTGDAC